MGDGDDGWLIGAADADGEGDIDDVEVGFGEGVVEDVEVGFGEGVIDDVEVGFGEGVIDDVEVGFGEGVIDDVALGLGEGAVSMGDTLGEVLGEGLGGSVWGDVGDGVGLALETGVKDVHAHPVRRGRRGVGRAQRVSAHDVRSRRQSRFARSRLRWQTDGQLCAWRKAGMPATEGAKGRISNRATIRRV